MSQTPSRSGDQQGARDYELRLLGHLDARWAARLGTSSLVNELDGTTTLRVRVLDQAALHGLLQQIRDLCLPLISVSPSESHPADHTPVDSQ